MNGEGYLQACGFLPAFGRYTVSHQPMGPGATGPARLQPIHALVIQGRVSGDDNDAQPQPWLGQHPVCSISAAVSSHPLLISSKNIISQKTVQECRCEVIHVRGLLQGQAGHRQRLVPAESPSGVWFDTGLSCLRTSRRDAQTSQAPLDQHKGTKESGQP